MATLVTVPEAAAVENENQRTVRLRRSVVVLSLVVLAFVVLSTLIALRTPAWEAADEPGHVQNVESLVAGHWYQMRADVGTEAHQPPLYYLVLAGWQKVTGQPARAVHPGPAALGRTAFRGIFVHHSKADHDFLLWLRLPNILLGLGTILLTVLAVRQVTTDPWTPVVAASFVAMTPRFIFLSAFVTNDNLAIFLGALLTVLALQFAARPRAWRAAAVGATLGLLVLTKLSTLPLFVVLIVVVLVTRSWLDRVRLTLIALASGLFVSSWYLLHNYNSYGDPLARDASAKYLQSVGGLGTFGGLPYRVDDPLRLILFRVPERIFTTFWYRSGWNQFYWPRGVSAIFWVLLAAMLVSLIGAHVAKPVVATLGLLAVASFASVWIVAFQTETYEPRLAFTALGALGGLVALGTARWKLALRFALPVAGFIAVLIAVHDDVLAVRWWR